ncbi:HAD family hydrolase [Alkalilacustris brevis]|uniref:HAD family hydrolase n=1 Tax=Alkalilacustris brevis TaxID=2026338 RepID=UPI000E0DDA7E|nr:HAD family hydrolase [Alkalilacustris brevis]
MPALSAVVFDKDGTLFDFHASWGNWTAALLEELAGGDRMRAGRLGAALGYDLTHRSFAPDSPVIAETPEILAQILLPYLPGFSGASLVQRMNVLAAQAQMVEAVPLAPFTASLCQRGLRLGLVTNDAEASARAHLAAAGIAAGFDFVAGFDSGHGAKPQPGMLLAFARSVGVDPAQVVMVGDSPHDMIAGRAAGMTTIGVLTGPSPASDLEPLADAILPDIGHLPHYLDRHRGKTEA